MTAPVAHLSPAIEPVQFGSESLPLFGIYHPPLDPRSRTLTVICPPLFHEYMRTHYALREVAVALSRAGHHVFRFDYAGTGDSSGELSAATLEMWISDVRAAVDEGVSLSGCSKVNVVSVRAGALIAARALSGRATVKSFVFWDPVSSGATYVAELRDAQRTVMRDLPLSRSDRLAADNDLAGYSLAPSLARDIEALGASVYSTVGRATVRVISTEPARAQHADCEVEHVPHACGWGHLVEDRLMPRLVLETIVRCSNAA